VPEDPTHILQELMPLAVTLGLAVERWEPAEVQVSVAWRPELCTSGGMLHGGVIMAVADSAVRDAQNRLIAKVSQTQMVLHA
jgi:acyl-coenzyme A thioesterase PaaI-like protein